VNDTQDLAFMSQLTVSNVDTNGTVQFVLDGVTYTAEDTLFADIETDLHNDGIINRADMLSFFSQVEADGASVSMVDSTS